jgi:hypothetical protein
VNNRQSGFSNTRGLYTIIEVIISLQRPRIASVTQYSWPHDSWLGFDVNLDIRTSIERSDGTAHHGCGVPNSTYLYVDSAEVILSCCFQGWKGRYMAPVNVFSQYGEKVDDSIYHLTVGVGV